MGKPIDIAIIVVYLAAMLAFGFWGKTRTKDSADFLVAGRRLGPALYTGTMAAVVLGGASTVGGVGLGYKYGISGMWLVVSIAVGLLLLSLVFAGRIQRLKVYTVAQMLKLRYGVDATAASGIVMVAYTLMLSVTSTIAYATIFNVLFNTNRTLSVIIGGAIVMLYSSIGGMWSITLTDMVQFVLKTIGIFFLLLPFTWNKAGGFDGIRERAGDAVFDLGAIGVPTIITFFVVYSFGMLIGQDIWQRVFTARSPGVAKWGGTTAALYCVLYGVAGAVIGMAASTFLPDVKAKDDVYAQIAETILPVGISGIVLAAAVAAMMSTASGALIATATVAKTDVKPLLFRLIGRDAPQEQRRGTRRALGSALRRGARHRRHRDRGTVQRRGRGADHRLRHPGRRSVGGDPRRLPVEAGDRHRCAVVDGRRHRRHPRNHVRGRRRAGQRADLLRVGREPGRLRRRQPADHAHPCRRAPGVGRPLGGQGRRRGRWSRERIGPLEVSDLTGVTDQPVVFVPGVQHAGPRADAAGGLGGGQ